MSLSSVFIVMLKIGKRYFFQVTQELQENTRFKRSCLLTEQPGRINLIKQVVLLIFAKNKPVVALMVIVEDV